VVESRQLQMHICMESTANIFVKDFSFLRILLIACILFVFVMLFNLQLSFSISAAHYISASMTTTMVLLKFSGILWPSFTGSGGFPLYFPLYVMG